MEINTAQTKLIIDALYYAIQWKRTLADAHVVGGKKIQPEHDSLMREMQKYRKLRRMMCNRARAAC